MYGKIQKWGKSLALRIPGAFARQSGLAVDTTVKIALDGDRISIRPVKPPEFSLAEALSRVTDENIHHAADFGDPVGGEAW
jgi:antitoxin component of MazEF toxin-antitoxin module